MRPIQINDRVPLSGLQRDSAGNVIGVAKAARTGIQIYAGYELGEATKAQVRVWRPEAEVFHRDSMASYAGAPVTIEHPAEQVNPTNWKDYAVGETASDEIVREGEIIKVPFMLRDAAAIKAIEDGKHEVSMGYTSIIDFVGGIIPDGQADAGQAYDAVQRAIRINHLAIVDKARGGPALRIGDKSPEQEERKMKTIIVDGLSVETSDAGVTAIEKLLADRAAVQAQLADANTQVGALTADKATLEGERAVLTAAIADATSPAKIAAAAKERATLISDALRVAPKGKFDDADAATIKRAVVEAKLGDAAKALGDGPAIDGAFAALVASAPAKAGAPVNDGLTNLINDDDGDFAPMNVTELADARDKAFAARNARYASFGKTA